jgi:hypothetical protein
MEEILLPLPFESDCYDYEQNKEPFSSKSKEDCILNYLKEKEYKKCKFNRQWFYEKYEFLSNKTRYKSHNCSIQYNKEQLIELMNLYTLLILELFYFIEQWLTNFALLLESDNLFNFNRTSDELGCRAIHTNLKYTKEAFKTFF